MLFAWASRRNLYNKLDAIFESLSNGLENMISSFLCRYDGIVMHVEQSFPPGPQVDALTQDTLYTAAVCTSVGPATIVRDASTMQGKGYCCQNWFHSRYGRCGLT